MKEQIFNLAEASGKFIAIEHKDVDDVVLLLHKSTTHILNLNHEGHELEKLAADQLTEMGFHYHIINSIEQVEAIINSKKVGIAQPETRRAPIDEKFNELGELIDSLDNLVHAISIPMPPDFHVQRLKEALPEKVAEFKELFIEITGENPWD